MKRSIPFKKLLIVILFLLCLVLTCIGLSACTSPDDHVDEIEKPQDKDEIEKPQDEPELPQDVKEIVEKIINAEEKVLEAEEYCMTCSLSVEVSADGYSERASTGVDWGEISEEGNKVQFYHIEDGNKLYRTCGFDFTYSNYGILANVEKSSNIEIAANLEPSKIEDFYGAEITLEEKDEECIYSVRFGKNEILKQLKKMPVDIGDVIDFDLSAIDFGDEIIIKSYVNKDGELYLTEVDDWKFSFDIQEITVDATMSLSLYIETDREKIVIPEVGQCLKYANYYNDEDNTLRWIKDHENPETAEIISDVDYVKSYKIENYRKEFGVVSGDSLTGKIAAASCDELELFSYVDIYDKDMRKLQTLCLRGAVEKIRNNKNYIALNLKESSFDGSCWLTLAVVNLDDGKIIYKINLQERDDYNAALFGNAFTYLAPTSDNGEDRVLKIYNIEKDELFTPTFDGKPLGDWAVVNTNGNILVRSGWYTLEINDVGEVVASNKIVTATFAGWFVGKYWVGIDYYDRDKNVYYNAEEELSYIDIGEYVGNGKAQFLYIDDSYAVILDDAGGGCFIYDFANREYILQDSDWEHGTIECHFYLGSAKWLTNYTYSGYINIFGV